ncbi:MAG: histidine kinase [Clostridium sp.]|uniref:sensor histidine kinase n=1 Tax=Clostridium sp. TaxID=1506 RepID=UPI0030471F24
MEMNNILNKIILLIGSITIILTNNSLNKAILPILIVVAITSFLEYFNKDELNITSYSMYCIICGFYPEFLVMIPVIFYDVIFSKYRYMIPVALIAYLINIESYSTKISLIIIVLIIVGIILKYTALKYEKLYNDFIKKRDDLTEVSLVLEENLKELGDKQDAEINLATLNERNRIAREIHDNVGHLLTSSILQIGATIALTKEESTKSLLGNIKNTLNEGMNSIRSSVHNLHEDSIDLHMQLLNLTKDFTFCEVNLNYEFSSNLDVKVKYSIIAIVKEALSNVIKHSNATKLSINLYEHPKLYQVIIMDNGTKKSKSIDNGMGLENIRKRVDGLKGIVNIDNKNGFKVFISFMKSDN